MGNRQKLNQAWGRYSGAVKRIRREWSEERAKLEGFRGSRLGDERIEAADDAFAAKLTEARNSFNKEVGPILADMAEKVTSVSESVTAPSDEMVRTLQAVAMMEPGTLSVKQYNAIGKMCRDNSIARATLESLGTTRLPEGTAVPKLTGPEAAAQANYRAIVDACKALGRWDGTSRQEAVASYGTERTNAGTNGTDTEAAIAGDIDAASPDFERRVIGMVYDVDALRLLD